MGLPQIFANLFVMDRVPELAQKIAAETSEAIWSRVSAKLASLRGAEQIGYVRARSTAIIFPAVDRLISAEGAKLALQRERLIAEATEIVTQQVRVRSQQTKTQTTKFRQAA